MTSILKQMNYEEKESDFENSRLKARVFLGW